jgi:hypothetical protein
MKWLCGGFVAAVLWAACAHGQVIEFESNGQKYQTLTRSGVTVIVSRLPGLVADMAILQASISNGSGAPYIIRPEDFSFVRDDGTAIRAIAANSVISILYKKGSGDDVVRLVKTYEAAVYGNPNIRSTNGFEQRRMAAMSMGGGSKVKAAATASALALVQTKLPAGDSTDGAVFFPTQKKPLGAGHVVVRTNTDTFEFKVGL